MHGLVQALNSSSAWQTTLSGAKNTQCLVLFFQKTWNWRRNSHSFLLNMRYGVTLMCLYWINRFLSASSESHSLTNGTHSLVYKPHTPINLLCNTLNLLTIFYCFHVESKWVAFKERRHKMNIEIRFKILIFAISVRHQLFWKKKKKTLPQNL